VLTLDDRNVVLILQVQPELRAVAEVAAEPHRGVGRDRTPAVENVGDATRRHAEVECDTVEQVAEAVAAGADLILCDNMDLDDLRRSVALARPAGVLLEASGGLSLADAHAVAATGVEYLAVGALTHSAPALDLGLDLEIV